MNYYQTAEYIFSTAKQNANGKPNTLLPLRSYNDYEQQVREAFTKCIEHKRELDYIVYQTLEQIESENDEDYQTE